MPSNFEDLMRDVFGDGRTPRRVSAAGAERYLEQARKTGDALDTLQKAGEDQNARMQKQLDELRRMSAGLDFDQIDREVRRDFGVTPAEAQAAAQRGAAPAGNSSAPPAPPRSRPPPPRAALPSCKRRWATS